MTDTQTIDLFHCLEVPYSSSYAAVDGMGAAYVQTANQPILSAAKSAILAFVAGMESLALTDLGSLLDEYHDIRSVSFSMSGGSVGSITGINFSADAMRDQLKKRVQELVPYYKYHEILAKQNGYDNSANINGMMIR